MITINNNIIDEKILMPYSILLDNTLQNSGVQNFINMEIALQEKINKMAMSPIIERASAFHDSALKMSEMLSSLANMQIENINNFSAIGMEIYKILEPFQDLSNTLQSLNLGAMYATNISLAEDKEEIEQEDVKLANEKIVTEILLPDNKKNIDISNSAIIKLSPINDNVLRYLADNPQELYNLSGGDFEEVMAKIYSKLGYDVERTKATRDGGKDLIIRKSEILGDFVYYVECKKYAADRPIGVGIVKNLACTINDDGVNGGILATTSFFTSDAIKHIKDYKYGYRIQMHDYDYIQNLLKKVN